MKHQRLEDQRHAPHLDLSKGDYYDAETYERKRMSLNSERKNDYQNFLSKVSFICQTSQCENGSTCISNNKIY